MKITTQQLKCKELIAGDLFSTASQFYWDNRDKNAVGEKVYIRTEAPCPPTQAEDDIYKITIQPLP